MADGRSDPPASEFRNSETRVARPACLRLADPPASPAREQWRAGGGRAKHCGQVAGRGIVTVTYRRYRVESRIDVVYNLYP